MTKSNRLSQRPVRSPRRIGAVALVTLTLLGAAASTASAEPDTNIQKPGHVTYQRA